MVDFFIQRPIFASAIAVIMVLAGSICYFLLPVSQFPDITPPQVVVSSVYPGASAQVVADTVTTPLEQQINGVAGMIYMSSSSSLRPLDAARAAMKEVTGPIIATTAVLMAVFVPVAFIPGVAGRLYNQFALTVAISVGISAFNSLTLSPALSAAFLRHRGDVHFAPFRWFNAGFDWLSHAYARSLRTLIRLRWTMLMLFVAGLGATYLVSLRIPSTFLPVEDQGYFFVVIQLPDGASLQRTDIVAKQVRDVVKNTPGVDIVGSISGINFLTSAAQ